MVKSIPISLKKEILKLRKWKMIENKITIKKRAIYLSIFTTVMKRKEIKKSIGNNISFGMNSKDKGLL